MAGEVCHYQIANPRFGGLAILKMVRPVDKVTPFGKGRKIATHSPWDYSGSILDFPPHKTETKTYDQRPLLRIERAIVKKLDIVVGKI